MNVALSKSKMKGNLKAAMIAYAALALVATFALDGNIRVIVWIVLGAFAVKTWIAHAAGWE